MVRRYDVGVHQETPRRLSPLVSAPPVPPMVPMSAEDFARGKRRKVLVWMGLGLLIVFLGAWAYFRSNDAQTARKALSDGEQLLKTTRYLEAVQSFNRVLSLDKNLPRAYLLRGRAKAALGQSQPAIQDFTKVLQLQPGNVEALMDRAMARFGSSDYAGAVADCGDAIRFDPKLAYAYTLRGMAFRETGSYPKALEDFNHSVELSPGPDTYFQRASVYQLLGDHHKAIADLNQMIALFPSSPMGYLARAKSRAALGDLAGARSDREESGRLEDRPPGQ